MKQSESYTIAILALGGQGGGVLTHWLVDVAEAAGFLAQSTYVAGVAQRTGATIYCIDFCKPVDGREPVFNLYPVPGEVDLVVTSELAEVGRALQKGFVTPEETTLITSSHRVYGITEKQHLGDGILDQEPVIEVAKQLSKHFIAFDMDELAKANHCVISAVLLGAIAGSQVLPFERKHFEQVIRADGRALETNLAGFDAGWQAANSPLDENKEDSADSPEINLSNKTLADQVKTQLPSEIWDTVSLGVTRLLDYQDRNYAESYIERVKGFCDNTEPVVDKRQMLELRREYSRLLALQMSYEDTIRVADLKTRQERSDRIKKDLHAKEQPYYLVEYFHPRFEEICDTLPARLGDYLRRSSGWKRWLAPLFEKGRHISSNKIGGFLLLHWLSKLRRFRRGTLRYRIQQEHLNSWDEAIQRSLPKDPALALQVVRCVELVSGYGDTYERGLHRYRESLNAVQAVPNERRAQVLSTLRQAALTDEQGIAFEKALKDVRLV